MAKRGPKPGSKWRWYLIKRERDGKYYYGKYYHRHTVNRYLFGTIDKARAWRLREAFTVLCSIRRFYRDRERLHRTSPPETFVLEVKGNPKAKIHYPWRMPS